MLTQKSLREFFLNLYEKKTASFLVYLKIIDIFIRLPVSYNLYRCYNLLIILCSITCCLILGKLHRLPYLCPRGSTHAISLWQSLFFFFSHLHLLLDKSRFHIYSWLSLVETGNVIKALSRECIEDGIGLSRQQNCKLSKNTISSELSSPYCVTLLRCLRIAKSCSCVLYICRLRAAIFLLIFFFFPVIFNIFRHIFFVRVIFKYSSFFF